MAVFWTSEHERAAYLKVSVRIRYIWRSGKKHMPVAWYTGSPTTVSPKSLTVRSSQEYGYRLVSFDVARLGAKPKVPSPEPDAAYGEELLESDFETGHLESLPNGAHIFWASGYHLFAITVPQSPAAAYYRTGRSPIERSSITGSTTFGPTDLDKGMSGLDDPFEESAPSQLPINLQGMIGILP